MPELPEVETVRRTLARRVVGRRVLGVDVLRAGVVYGMSEGGRGPSQRASSGRSGPVALRRALLEGEPLTDVGRHGKQLAMLSRRGAGVCVHLGMSGSLRVVGRPTDGTGGDHVHVVWRLSDGSELRFRDPRRFGGLWTFATKAELHEMRWSKLGPDALTITPGRLHAGLSRTRRWLKAALLDQRLVAGLGNIYVDELLFAVGLHPRRTAAAVTKPESRRLVAAMRRLLNRAIAAGGSTLRDYADGEGRPGGFQTRHRVYGRGGEPCARCGRPLEVLEVAGRTTCACGRCQRV
ncbi:MAG: bifunctional DNA-formamidopyrimidine glycosylase/DNA-(apurinic or apyrimidinic site) lyase [Planctomycetota bacterium]